MEEPLRAYHHAAYNTAGSASGNNSVGFLRGGNANGPLSEEQLRARGQTQSQANRNLVGQQTEEIAMNQLSTRVRAAWMLLICLFCCTIFPLCLAVFCVTIWAAIAVDEDAGKSCDQPIRIYVWGFILLVCWVNWCQNAFIKCVLGYDPQVDGVQRPRRVQLYHSIFLLINVGWNVTGMVWVVESNTCHETAPHMYESAQVLVFLQLTVYVLFGCMMGIFCWLYWAVRNGQIRSPDAAPEGFVENLETVAFDAALFNDHHFPKECAICFEPFSSANTGDHTIVKTQCDKPHVYHKKCLENWLNGSQTCPICRSNLVEQVSSDTDLEQGQENVRPVNNGNGYSAVPTEAPQRSSRRCGLGRNQRSQNAGA